jgi:hypothetical protein
MRVHSADGLRAIEAGPICNSAAAEALTSLLIFFNRKYKVSGSGIRVAVWKKARAPDVLSSQDRQQKPTLKILLARIGRCRQPGAD